MKRHRLIAQKLREIADAIESVDEKTDLVELQVLQHAGDFLQNAMTDNYALEPQSFYDGPVTIEVKLPKGVYRYTETDTML